MACISMPAALIGSSVLGAGTSLLGASMQSNAAQEAAQTQANAAMQAEQMMFKEFGITRQDLAPFFKGGAQDMGALNSLMGVGLGGGGFINSFLGKPFQPTMAQLSATPGYQFALNQGEQAVNNQFASQGLGQSGAEMKGASGYAEGLASQTFQQQQENYLATRAQDYSMLSGGATIGANAAAQSGTIGSNLMGNAANFLTSSAAATAGGIMGSANAWTNGLYGMSNSFGNNALMYAMMSGNGNSGGWNSDPFGAIESANPGYWNTFGGSGSGFPYNWNTGG